MQVHRDILDGMVKVFIPGVHAREGLWVAESARIDDDRDPRHGRGHRRERPGPVGCGHRRLHRHRRQLRDRRRCPRDPLGRLERHVRRQAVHGRRGGAVPPRGRAGARRHRDGCGDRRRVGGRGGRARRRRRPGSSRTSASSPPRRSTRRSSGSRPVSRSLFGDAGVQGLVGVDITPELALKVAEAYGTLLPKGGHVVISRDTTRPARMLKRAMIAGLNAAGIDVRDLRVASPAVSRFTTQKTRCVGGVHLSGSMRDPQSLEIRFFDKQRPRHRAVGAEEDRAALLPRGVPARVLRRARRHHLPAATARVLRRRR